MRGRIPIALAALVTGALLASPASAAAPAIVDVGDDFYAPKKYEGSIGTDVNWLPDVGAADEHNVLANSKLFDSGSLTTSIDYTISPSAGTFAYYCSSHGTKSGNGMAGTLKVAPAFGSMKRGGSFVAVNWASDGSFAKTGDQYDVRWKGPGTKGKYKNWLKNTADGGGDFGTGNQPTNYKPNKKYSIQARSEDSSKPKKRKSGWSP
ncbi:MAG: hypothetical protein ABI726_11190, partial [bacterium]